MKVSAVISPKLLKGYTLKYDKISVLNFIVLSAGLISGSIIYILSQEYLTGELWEKFISFSTDFSSKTNVEILSGLIISHLPYIILVLIFGTSAFGKNLIIILSFIKAMGLGLVSAYIYSNFGLKGIEYSIIVFFPGKFLLLLAMMVLMYIGISSCNNIKKALAGDMIKDYSLSSYLTKAIVAVIIFIFSVMIEFLVIICFSSLFNFS